MTTYLLIVLSSISLAVLGYSILYTRETYHMGREYGMSIGGTRKIIFFSNIMFASGLLLYLLLLLMSKRY
jgi:hypothetical protein